MVVVARAFILFTGNKESQNKRSGLQQACDITYTIRKRSPSVSVGAGGCANGGSGSVRGEEVFLYGAQPMEKERPAPRGEEKKESGD